MLNRPILFSILFLLIALSSCDGGANTDDVLTPDYVGADTGKVTFDMYPMTRAQMQNTQVYLFNGGPGANRGMYDSRIPSLLSIEENEAEHRAAFSMLAKIGLWNIVLVHAEEASSLAALTPPYRAAGVTMNDLPMWQTLPVGEVLPSVPELMTAHIDDRQVVPNVNNTGSGSMVRNVAQVRINVVRASGLKLGGQHYVRLGGVPTTLSWAGGLLPDRSHPTVGDKLMSQTLTAIADPGDPDNQVSQGDGAVFIIPAHKGFDWPASNPTDTTEQKLTLHVDFELSDGQRFVRSAEIRITPKMNRILSVDLRLDVELGMAVEVLDWEEVDIPADLRQTHIQIDKTNVALSYRDTVFVKSNRPLVATTAASWLSVRPLDDERYEITADVDTYTAQRSGTIDFRADNLTKRIGVTQRPEVGTISAPASFWVSPTGGNTSRTIAVQSTAEWTMTSPSVTTATPNRTTGNAGATAVAFTRKAHSGTIQMADYPKYYGNTVFTLKNRYTLETITVTAQNLYLEIDDLNVPNATGNNIKENTDMVRVFGGAANFSLVSKPTWITSATINPATKSITLAAPGEPTGERREGTMTFRHNDDPGYVVTVSVIQDFLITIPPFDFFVIKYTWNNSDVDIDVRFEGNGAAFDNKGVGYVNSANIFKPSRVSSVSYNTETLLQWGGDATGGQGETVFFNAPLIDNAPVADNLPRYIKIVCRAVWWTYSRSGSPVRTTVFAYKGGYMNHVGTNFNNVGGDRLYTGSRQQQVSSWTGRDTNGDNSVSNNDGLYIDLVTITYDRVKHSADIRYMGTEMNSPAISTPATRAVVVPYLTPEQQAEAAAAAAQKELESQQ